MSLLSAMGLMDAPQSAGDFALQAAVDPVNLAMVLGPLAARAYPGLRNRVKYGREVAQLAKEAGVRKVTADAAAPGQAEAMLSELATLRQRHPGLAELPELRSLDIGLSEPERMRGNYNITLPGRRMTVRTPEPYESLSGPLQAGQEHVDKTPLGVVRHEFGHHIFHRMPAEDQRMWDHLLESAGYDSISPYVFRNMRTADTEGFAEAMAAVSHPRYRHGSLPATLEDFIESVLSGRRRVAWRQPPPSLAALISALGLPGYNTVMAAQAMNANNDSPP